jgi:hypothetical protein
MPHHPSVTAAFLPPEQLSPVASMDAYALCWCRSGRKFKFCHYRRDRKKPVNIFEKEQEMLVEFRQGYCSHPEAGTACSPKITDAHTVQRRGGLAAIAEDGHVLTIKPSMQALIEHEGTPPPRRIGIGRASVFPGFCNVHDSVTFKPIEGKDIALDKPAALLFAYRTIAYERFTKAAALKTIDVQRELDFGQSFWKQALIQKSIHAYARGLETGMRDVEAWKAAYDTQLFSSDMEGFSFYAIRFDRLLPLVGCGAFHPEYDFLGGALQRLARRPFAFEHLSLSITAFAERTVAIFGWLGEHDGPAGKFVATFQALPDDRKADALVRLAFEQLENIYMTPGWWYALGPDDKAALLCAVRSGTPLAERKANCLIDRGSTYVDAKVVETSAG